MKTIPDLIKLVKTVPKACKATSKANDTSKLKYKTSVTLFYSECVVSFKAFTINLQFKKQYTGTVNKIHYTCFLVFSVATAPGVPLLW